MDDFILELKSGQTSNIRILFEVLKDVVVGDINLVFTEETIKVIEMDKTEVCVVHLSLDTSSFEFYECKKPRIVAGINSTNFFKIIKTAGNKDIISFLIKSSEPNLFIIRFNNPEKNKTFESVINLMDVKYNDSVIPDIAFQSVVTIPSNVFEKICKDINSLGSSDRVEIQGIGDQLVIKHKGYFSEQRIVLGATDNTNITNSTGQIIQGIFDLKFLLLFTKATKLCSIMKIYLKNDYAIILEYSVGSLGKIKFVLANI
jgi:proliferating cell nuclear antigen